MDPNESARGVPEGKSILKRRQRHPLQVVAELCQPDSEDETTGTRCSASNRRVSFAKSEVKEFEKNAEATTVWGDSYFYDIQKSSESEQTDMSEAEHSPEAVHPARGASSGSEERGCDKKIPEGTLFMSVIKHLESSKDVENLTEDMSFTLTQDVIGSQDGKGKTAEGIDKVCEEERVVISNTARTKIPLTEERERKVPSLRTDFSSGGMPAFAPVFKTLAEGVIKKENSELRRSTDQISNNPIVCEYNLKRKGSNEKFPVSSIVPSSRLLGQIIPSSLEPEDCEMNLSLISASPTVALGRILGENNNVMEDITSRSMNDLTESVSCTYRLGRIISIDDHLPEKGEKNLISPPSRSCEKRKHSCHLEREGSFETAVACESFQGASVTKSKRIEEEISQPEEMPIKIDRRTKSRTECEIPLGASARTPLRSEELNTDVPMEVIPDVQEQVISDVADSEKCDNINPSHVMATDAPKGSSVIKGQQSSVSKGTSDDVPLFCHEETYNYQCIKSPKVHLTVKRFYEKGDFPVRVEHNITEFYEGRKYCITVVSKPPSDVEKTPRKGSVEKCEITAQANSVGIEGSISSDVNEKQSEETDVNTSSRTLRPSDVDDNRRAIDEQREDANVDVGLQSPSASKCLQVRERSSGVARTEVRQQQQQQQQQLQQQQHTLSPGGYVEDTVGIEGSVSREVNEKQIEETDVNTSSRTLRPSDVDDNQRAIDEQREDANVDVGLQNPGSSKCLQVGEHATGVAGTEEVRQQQHTLSPRGYVEDTVGIEGSVSSEVTEKQIEEASVNTSSRTLRPSDVHDNQRAIYEQREDGNVDVGLQSPSASKCLQVGEHATGVARTEERQQHTLSSSAYVSNPDPVLQWIVENQKRFNYRWHCQMGRSGTKMGFYFVNSQVLCVVKFDSSLEHVEEKTFFSKLGQFEPECLGLYFDKLFKKKLEMAQPKMADLMRVREDIPQFITFLDDLMVFFPKFQFVCVHLLRYCRLKIDDWCWKLRVTKLEKGIDFIIKVDMKAWTGGRLYPHNIEVENITGLVRPEIIERLTYAAGSGVSVLLNFMKVVHEIIGLLDSQLDGDSCDL